MKIALDYSGSPLELDIPDSFSVETFAPRSVDRTADFAAFRDEFQSRGGEAAIGGSPLIVINDGYRNTPTPLVIEWLDQLASNLLDRSSFLIATGTHDAPTEEHYRNILGRFHDRLRPRTDYHRCEDYATMAKFTDDPLGGKVLVNRAVLNDRPVLIIGSVEPHYFAGFTGGRKAIFPGLVDLATTERNHNLAASLDAAPLRLTGNPVAEHLQLLTDQIDSPRFFSIQVVLDVDHRPAGVFCGRLADSFGRAVALADQIYAHHVPRKYDIVLAELRPPLDKNLYQLQKAVENCQAAVADGGALIVLSACEEGIGSPHFYGLAERWDPMRNLPADGSPVTFGSHKLSRVVTITRRVQVLVHTRVAKQDVRRVFYEPLDNVQDFLYSKRDDCEKCNVAVVYDAGHTVLAN